MSSISPLNNNYSSGYGYTSPVSGRGPEAAPVTGKEKVNSFGIGEEGKKECQTCKNRKYQDGSNEMVSFKSPAHVDPQFAGTMVRAHEQEHVSNAYTKAAEGNGKVLSASVAIHTAVCPECGKPYVSGGTTQTQIKYNNEENPYQQDQKARDYARFGGQNAQYMV